MELAYIISAYQYPEQLIRLIHRLNGDATSFFVHVDKKAEECTFRAMVDGLGDLPNVRFLKRHRCDWGGFGHVAATLEGIADIVTTGTSFDYLTLLTGQDYPIKSHTHMVEFFEQHRGTLFLEFFPLPTDSWHDGRRAGGMERIEAWHWRIFHRHIRFPPGNRLPFRRKFPRGFSPFGGSSYWCLPRDCVEYISELTTRHRAFINFFKCVDVPDEIFFQTIVLNSPLRDRAVSDDLRYIDWKDPAAGRPAILRKSDFDRLLVSPKLFARKFDAHVDAEVLDLIDERILRGPVKGATS
jgi:hypothetical protein